MSFMSADSLLATFPWLGTAWQHSQDTLENITASSANISEWQAAASSTDPEAMRLAVYTWLALEAPFWIFCGLVHVLCHRLKIVGKKINPTRKPPDMLVQHAAIEVLANHLIVHPLALWFLMPKILSAGYLQPLSAPAPGLWEVAWQTAAFLFINDTLFYWVHRAFHSRLLFKHFHKKHHDFHTSIGIAAEYSGIVEAVVADAAPLVAGPLWLGAYYDVHAYTWCFWLAFRIWETCDAHCGYELPLPLAVPFSDVLRHDWHHSKNNGNYGGMTVFWDWICGTDAWAYHQRKLKKDAAAKQQ